MNVFEGAVLRAKSELFQRNTIFTHFVQFDSNNEKKSEEKKLSLRSRKCDFFLFHFLKASFDILDYYWQFRKPWFN